MEPDESNEPAVSASGSDAPPPGGSHDEVFVAHGSLAELRFVALFGRKGVLSGALAINRVRQLMGYRRMMREGASFDAAVSASCCEISMPPRFRNLNSINGRWATRQKSHAG